MLPCRFGHYCLGLWLMIALSVLSGCASSPKLPQQAGKPSSAETVSKPPPTANDGKNDTAVETLPQNSKSSARFVAVSWSQLPDWSSDTQGEAWHAWLRSCVWLQKRQPTVWAGVCRDANALGKSPDDAEVRAFFESRFTPYLLATPKNLAVVGLLTGYYEPLFKGSLTRQGRYRHPALAVPDDLINVELGRLYPALANMRVRGRLQGKTLLPYPERAQIVAKAPADRQVLAWLDDALNLASMQIQGSGRIALVQGGEMRLGYANQNGHPFVALGKTLVDWGELKANEVTAQAIRAWVDANPERAESLLNSNPSYVFFRKLDNLIDPIGVEEAADKLGPPGALGIPLTAGRSVAADPTVIQLGAPVYLKANNADPISRLVLIQDTGGAIKGQSRYDFYWGSGHEAGKQAGQTRWPVTSWLLWPRTAGAPGWLAPLK